MDPALGGPYEFGSRLSGARQGIGAPAKAAGARQAARSIGALRTRFLGAGLLLAGMRILPGGDRLRLRG